jgi:glycogen debranching enzyme
MVVSSESAREVGMEGLDFAGESAPVGAGTTTVLSGSTFVLSHGGGDIDTSGPLGFFSHDTRVLSSWRVEVDGRQPEPLAQHQDDPWRCRFIARVITGGHRLLVDRERTVHEVMQEHVRIENLTREPTSLTVRIRVATDFASLFAVKEGRSGHLAPASVSVEGDHLVLGARAQVDGARVAPPVTLRVEAPGAALDGDGLTYDVHLPARGRWEAVVRAVPVVDGVAVRSGVEQSAAVVPQLRQEAWEGRTAELGASDPTFAATLQRSVEDLGSLRIFDQAPAPTTWGDDPAPEPLPVVAAGSPWFMTLFGRDSLLTSYMTLALDPTLALGVLRALARHQGTRTDVATEEQPGRILHEVRTEDEDQQRLGRRRIYYGTADATPLFVALLGEYARWHGPTDDVAQLLPAADRALAWVDDHGDVDADGFVEYQRMTPQGLVNQGWKDSWDGVTFADGTVAEPPIALCEVQGYVYAAFRARSALGALFGDTAAQERWDARAQSLKEAFNARFWLEDRGWFAMGLDRDKRPIDSLASNMGQALWTGIVDDRHAGPVARQLLSPELFNGWGVRTLATSMAAYDPLSYHNGSVWPHDSALIAYGLMRHGFVDEAQRIATGLLDAAGFVGGRLPELFAGLDRRHVPIPVPYPTACSPQAWAAAAPVHLLRTLVGLEPALHRGELGVQPRLPESLGSVRLARLPLAGGRVDIHAKGRTIDVDGLPPGLSWVEKP